MKKLLSIFLLLSLGLTLCACGRKKTAPENTGVTNEYTPPAEALPLSTEEPAVVYRNYDSIAITADNWNTYFEICEVPLSVSNPGGGVREVVENYCVTLREEFAHRLRQGNDYEVNFDIAFDVYVNTLDVDRANFSYRHTDDLLFCLRAEHSCTFNYRALPKSAYGTDQSAYLLNGDVTYRNAFFSGTARYTVPDGLPYSAGAWAGFYVDLNTVEVVSASGTLALGY